MLKRLLDDLYAGFNHPESARDPIQIVRRYERPDDREVVAYIAAALAFGRVASVMASIDAICAVLGPAPARAVREFDPPRDGRPLRRLVHRWTKGADFVALIWILHRLLEQHGTLERAFKAGVSAPDPHVGPGIEAFADAARAVDLRPAYGRIPRAPGVYYFFARPSTGAACKRFNLFLRWMVRRDGVDPGGWTAVSPRQLVVPLDTHTIRIGRCLGLTKRVSPGWPMAVEITESLRQIDPDDPVRYDFSLCHLSMMGGCVYGAPERHDRCPLRSYCSPIRRGR